MPRLIYKPEGVEPKNFDFDFGKLMSAERIVIEKAATKALGQPVGWTECQRLFFANSTPVIGAFLFVMLKRERPDLRMSEFDFCDDDWDADLSDEEGRSVLAQMDSADEDDLTPREIAAREELRARFAEEEDEDGAEVTELPKAKKRA